MIGQEMTLIFLTKKKQKGESEVGDVTTADVGNPWQIL